MGTNGTANYWLPNCDLSGGSSGGPWQQGNNDGNDPVFSVNSWGYTRSPGMAGPKLHNNSAQALFTFALDSTMGYPIIGHVVNSLGGLVSSGTSTTTSTTVAPTTAPTTTLAPTTTVAPDGLVGSATSQGRTWTAIVDGPNGLAGSFDAGPADCSTDGRCVLSSLRKNVGSVTFTATAPDEVGSQQVTILKP
jgi:hypothetical protein